MKKLLLSAALLLCMCIGAMAQTKLIVNNGPIGLDWKFKRSFLSGNTLVVDFVVENNTSKDIDCMVVPNEGSGLKAFDDEGNVYTYENKNFSGTTGSKNQIWVWESVPVGNLIKVRLQISGIDEYATLIKNLTVPIATDSSNGRSPVATYSELRVTSIPIPRE